MYMYMYNIFVPCPIGSKIMRWQLYIMLNQIHNSSQIMIHIISSLKFHQRQHINILETKFSIASSIIIR